MRDPAVDTRRELVEAVKAGNELQVRELLTQGASPNEAERATGQTVLMLAAGRGLVSTVATLLKWGALPNVLDGRAGASALHKACQGGHFDVAQVLVAAGALIDLQCATTGHTPLVEAVWFKADNIVQLLIEQNARIELNTYYGFTLDQHINYALNVSKGQGDQAALRRIQELVIDRRARDRARQDSATLIQAVVANEMVRLEAILSGPGPDVDQRWPVIGTFNDGHTALLIAAREGKSEMVRVLIDAGADVNAIEPVFGAVPLHKATYNGNNVITEILAAAHGINLDYQGPSNGYTPLLDALWHGFADCARALLEKGASAKIRGYDGKLPLDLANEKLGPDNPLTQELANQSNR